MIRLLTPLFAASVLVASIIPGQAAEKLVVSTWGGSFRDLIDEAIGETARELGYA